MDKVQKEWLESQLKTKNTVGVQLKSIKFSGLLNQMGFVKKASNGYKINGLIYRLIIVLYMNKPIKCLWDDKPSIATCLKGPKKDNYYRLAKNPKLNWRRLLIGLYLRLVKPLKTVSRLEDQVLILDDTSNPKSGKKIEYLSVNYDHATHTYYRGFTQLHLGWSDGHHYLPVDFCVKVGKKIVSSWRKKLDARTNGARRRKESFKSKLDQSLEMLKRAYQNNIEVGYVLFDTWFAKPKFVLSVLNIGYHSVFNLPKGDKVWQVIYNGEKWTMKQLYRLLKKNKKFKKVWVGDLKQEVASIVVSHANGLKIKLVFCKTPHQKEWLVFASTNTSQTQLSILEIYSKRWIIETFFKSCKQLLQFGQEQSIDFDVQISMTTIRLMAYAIATIINRTSLDERTMGSLFEDISNEFSRLNLDTDVLMAMFSLVLTHLGIKDLALEKFKATLDAICLDFIQMGFDFQEKQVA